eukprot:scaffold7.g3413.t1
METDQAAAPAGDGAPSPIAPTAPADPRLERVGFARLLGEGIDFVVRKYEVTLGRKSKSNKSDCVLGDVMSLSREHARIRWDWDEKCFELEVDGQPVAAGEAVPLRSQAELRVGSDILFHFLLPKDLTQRPKKRRRKVKEAAAPPPQATPAPQSEAAAAPAPSPAAAAQVPAPAAPARPSPAAALTTELQLQQQALKAQQRRAALEQRERQAAAQAAQQQAALGALVQQQQLPPELLAQVAAAGGSVPINALLSNPAMLQQLLAMAQQQGSPGAQPPQQQ